MNLYSWNSFDNILKVDECSTLKMMMFTQEMIKETQDAVVTCC